MPRLWLGLAVAFGALGIAAFALIVASVGGLIDMSACMLTHPMLVFSVLSGAFAKIGGEQSLPPGHCQTCGYDLRSTPERCPECGASPKDAPEWHEQN